MTTENSIKDAIARSISHDEIVKVAVQNITAALAEVNDQADDFGHAADQHGEDVWGTTEDGKEFRLLLVIA